MIILEIYFFIAIIYCLYKFGAYILKIYAQPFIWIHSIMVKDENEADSRFKLKLFFIPLILIVCFLICKEFLKD